MTDIVERLRNPSGDLSIIPMCREAADEIEALRAALQKIGDFPYVGTQASQEMWGIARRALEPKP